MQSSCRPGLEGTRYSAAFAVRRSSSGFLTSTGALPCGVGSSTYLKAGSLFHGPRASSWPSLRQIEIEIDRLVRLDVAEIRIGQLAERTRAPS